MLQTINQYHKHYCKLIQMENNKGIEARINPKAKRTKKTKKRKK